jgi:hypothetical protein
VWGPALQGDEQLLIFVPTPSSFILGPNANMRWKAGELRATRDGTLSESISQADLVYYPDKVGLGAAAAAVRFSLLCARMGHTSHLRFGRDLALVDLRSHPAVILGAFSSPWAGELNNGYRFRLRAGVNGRSNAIIDSQDPGRLWIPEQRPDTWPIVDYAIAARILHPVTGQYVFVAAGVSTFGTQSAAEFLTDEKSLRTLEAIAPPGWEKKNFQVVLRVRVIGNSPGPPTIVAWHVW